jgi:RHS repeat-associated protein
LSDALGSVRAITDPSGAVSGTAAYDPFGATTTSTGARSIFGFAGETSDASGIYLRARTLDPATGTFGSTDPVRPGAPGVVGYNPYSYVGNDPTTRTDPSGLMVAEYATVEEEETVPALTVIEGGLGKAAPMPFWKIAAILGALIGPPLCLAICFLPGPGGDTDPAPGPQPGPGQPGPAPAPAPEPGPAPGTDPQPNPQPDPDDDTNPCKGQPPGYPGYGPLIGDRQASGIAALLTYSMLGTGTPANPALQPPGWLGGPLHNRSHLLANRLGGSGDIYENIVTMYARPNQIEMRAHEAEVAAAVASCEVVTYVVVPHYTGTGTLPVSDVSMDAVGDRGFARSWTVENEP